MNFRSLAFAAGAAFTLATATAEAGVIPYPDPGTVNPVTYSFTATGGDVVAYFTSNGGSYTNILGLRVGATDYMSTLNNQTSTPGDSFNFGSF
ncbi:MAG: hypothetical protein J0H41_15560, partial [Rhizobiales bacterium]|nr:hypothetical protein [Hyphomicrobiales bacterium]